MFLSKKPVPVFYFTLLSIVCISALVALQLLWLYNAYCLSYSQFIVEINEAFDEACHKERAYRMPVQGLVDQGNFTIQSCGAEEIKIIRYCPDPDTVVYDNVYGHSLETFINRAFYELRDHVLPLNIYCLADLFAGALHDKEIPASFVIERFNTITGDILETSAITPDTHEANTLSTHIIITNVSETEGLRANLKFTKKNIFSRMAGTLFYSVCLLLIILACLYIPLRALYRITCQGKTFQNDIQHIKNNSVFHLGNYSFDADKNELLGFGQRLNLNRKENGILQDLCTERGNVVERNFLLEKHWGSVGFIYSRSLDTYITTLRKYLKDDESVQIATIKGVGYKLVVNHE